MTTPPSPEVPRRRARHTRRARLTLLPLLLGTLLLAAPPATASYVLDAFVDAPSVSVVPQSAPRSDLAPVAASGSGSASGSGAATPQPGDGVAPDSTQGTDADVAADQGVEDGGPVWIFYLVVVLVAVTGLVVGLLRNRRRKRQH